MKVFKCDNEECNKETVYIHEDEWIEIGSEGGTLYINNFCKEAKLTMAKRFRDMHFCSKKCLIDRLFL